jgi:hypothetical protein
MTTSFETDKNYVKSVSYNVTDYALSDGIVTLTLDVVDEHNFAIGQSILISGISSTFNGTYTITDLPADDQVSYKIVSSDEVLLTEAPANAFVASPAPTYIRYPSQDTFLDDIVGRVNFYVEPWDYNTVRLIWSVDAALHEKAIYDISQGRTPRVVVTRSSFGYPSTPLDGQKILDRKYADTVATIDGQFVVPYLETQPESNDNDFKRPSLSTQGLYDRNLTPGHWYYYTIFFYLQGTGLSQEWIEGGSMDALTPYNYKTADTLYELVPPYYRTKDKEFLAGDGQQGVLERLIKVIGFEADYTRTLSEGIENVYNVDYTHDDLLHALGETNLGVGPEAGLGDIRYRSLLTTINTLYNRRGTKAGLQRLTSAAVKYNSKIVEGVNQMNVFDDAEFLTNSGSWANIRNVWPVLAGEVGYDFVDWVQNVWEQPDTTIGFDWIYSEITDYNEPSLTVVDGETGSPADKRGALEISKANEADPDGDALIVACGMGEGEVYNRLHDIEVVYFEPQFHGIRCNSGDIYTFSFYSRRIDGTAGDVVAGVLWFNLPANHQFVVEDDLIAADRSVHIGYDSSSATMTRYSVQSEAPISKRGEQNVYAVPYIAFSNSSTRRISACMFNSELNSAASFAVQPDISLTLGDTSEFIGDLSLFMGDA